MCWACLLKRELNLVLKDDRTDLFLWEGASPKQDLQDHAEGLYVVCHMSKLKKKNIAVISLQAIFFNSHMFLYIFPLQQREILLMKTW